LKKLMLLAAVLVTALAATVPAVAQVSQETGQESESGDVEVGSEVASESNSVNQCVALLQSANTGNLQNGQGILQDAGVSKDTEAAGGTIALSPALAQACEQTIKQAAAAGKGKKATPPSESKLPKAKAEAGGAEAGGAEADAAEAGVAEATKMEAKEEEKKELPKTGGNGGTSLLGLGTGALLVGGGLLVRRLFGRHG
jgi:LPXTG-motif cell wall-anchored protein